MPAGETLIDLARAGYLPTEINVDDGVVSLAKLAHAGFREVWYGDTTAAADAEQNQVVPFQTFVDQFAGRRDVEHLRLIAHTSRCGSTLLANLLTLRPTTMVLKEPDFVTIPAKRIALATNDVESRKYDALLKALLNFSCHTAAAAGRELVIKITSWTVPVVAASLSKCENTTWLFLWREPEKVVASNMATPSTWGRETENGLAARRLAGVDDLATDAVRFYANTWFRTVDSFLSADRDLAWRALDYQDLVNEKATSLLATESWFNLAPTAELPAIFEQESRRYSKGSQAEVFEPSKTHLRSPLEPRAAEDVGAITKQALETLREEKDHRLF
jgi:hypothetical protein